MNRGASINNIYEQLLVFNNAYLDKFNSPFAGNVINLKKSSPTLPLHEKAMKFIIENYKEGTQRGSTTDELAKFYLTKNSGYNVYFYTNNYKTSLDQKDSEGNVSGIRNYTSLKVPTYVDRTSEGLPAGSSAVDGTPQNKNNIIGIDDVTANSISFNVESKYTDICLMQSIDPTSAVANGTNIFYTKNILQGLYAWHSLLDPIRWQSLMKGNTEMIHIPNDQGAPNTPGSAMDHIIIKLNDFGNEFDILYYIRGDLPSRLNEETLTAANLTGNIDPSATNNNPKTQILDIMNKILNIKKVLSYNSNSQVGIKKKNQGKELNIFVLRKMMYLYILLINFGLSVDIYSRNNQQFISEKILVILRKSINDINNEDGYLKYITKFANFRMQLYQNRLKYIDNINDQIDIAKDVYTERRKKLSERVALTGKISIINYVTITLFCILTVGSAVLLIIDKPLKTKVIVGCVMITVSLIYAFTIQFLIRNKLIENFTGETLTEKDSIIQQMNSKVIFYADEYLTSAFLSLNTINSFNTYGNANTSIVKEIGFFKNTRDVLINGNEKLKASASMYRLMINNTVYRIYFMITLSVVSCICVMGYISTESIPILQKIILRIGIFVIIGAILLTIMGMSKQVRTNPRTKYWAPRKLFDT